MKNRITSDQVQSLIETLYRFEGSERSILQAPKRSAGLSAEDTTVPQARNPRRDESRGAGRIRTLKTTQGKLSKEDGGKFADFLNRQI